MIYWRGPVAVLFVLVVICARWFWRSKHNEGLIVVEVEESFEVGKTSLNWLPNHYLLSSDGLKDIPNRVIRRLYPISTVNNYRRSNIGAVWSSARENLFGWNDPLLPKQWHLFNTNSRNESDDTTLRDVNVLPVWKSGINGTGITVCIVDDGVDYNHPDLKGQVNLAASFDFNDNNSLPMPQSKTDQHGTRCAGQIVALPNNGQCGVGVAFGAKVSAIRILSKKITTVQEAAAVVYRNDLNDIYSCSWGPNDDGKTVEGPDALVLRSFISGLMKGREGKGSIFVFAAGNGRAFLDNCNYDGYANNPFSVTIGAIDHEDRMPYYMEECAAMLTVTYSSNPQVKITTTDLDGKCTDRHGGTSAAAPLAAGIIALMMSSRPDLTWRDVQYLLIEGAVPFRLEDPSWRLTASGKYFSNQFGYGKMDAERLVNLTRSWTLVNPPVIKSLPWLQVKKSIPAGKVSGIQSTLTVTPWHLQYFELNEIKALEHVTVSVNVKHTRRGDLIFYLKSPNGTISQLTTRRPNDDDSTTGLMGWTFMSVAFWSESIVSGDWTLQVINSVNEDSQGELIAWRITFWGESRHKGGDLDRETYSLQFMNNYYPPTVDYFNDFFNTLRQQFNNKDEEVLDPFNNHHHHHHHKTYWKDQMIREHQQNGREYLTRFLHYSTQFILAFSGCIVLAAVLINTGYWMRRQSGRWLPRHRTRSLIYTYDKLPE